MAVPDRDEHRLRSLAPAAPRPTRAADRGRGDPRRPRTGVAAGRGRAGAQRAGAASAALPRATAATSLRGPEPRRDRRRARLLQRRGQDAAGARPHTLPRAVSGVDWYRSLVY